MVDRVGVVTNELCFLSCLPINLQWWKIPQSKQSIIYPCGGTSLIPASVFIDLVRDVSVNDESDKHTAQVSGASAGALAAVSFLADLPLGIDIALSFHSTFPPIS